MEERCITASLPWLLARTTAMLQMKMGRVEINTADALSSLRVLRKMVLKMRRHFLGFGRVKHQIGMNSLCEALPSPTTLTTNTIPTPTPSFCTRLMPLATLTNFWPSHDFFLRAYRIENAGSRFFPESDSRSPTASKMRIFVRPIVPRYLRQAEMEMCCRHVRVGVQ